MCPRDVQPYGHGGGEPVYRLISPKESERLPRVQTRLENVLSIMPAGDRLLHDICASCMS